MSRRGRALLGSTVAMLLLVLAWWQLAPTPLLGSALYATTDGNSMLPLLDEGELVQVRTTGPFEVGDIVLYNNRAMGTTVLHRIIAITEGNYVFRGDNNNFLDPGTVDRADLIGTMKWHVPALGTAVGYLRSPMHTGWIAALIAFFALGGGGLLKRGRRTARRRTGAGSSTPPSNEPPRAGGRWPWHDPLIDPLHNAIFITLAVLLIGSLAVGAAAFRTPTEHDVQHADHFQHEGTFSYSADVDRPTPAYPSGTAGAGQTLFLDLFSDAEFTFDYRFVSDLSHTVEGEISMNALISSQSNWEQLYPLVKPQKFSSDSASSSVTVDIDEMRAFIRQLSAASGAVGSEYHVAFQPVVEIEGTVDGNPYSSTFSPVLPITITDAILKVDAGADQLLAPPGSSDAPSSSTLDTVLKPRQAGQVTVVEPNRFSALGIEMGVSTLRIASITAALLAVAGLTLFFLLVEPPAPRPHIHRIARRAGCAIVEVHSIQSLIDRLGAIEVAGFEKLVELAAHHDGPVLHEQAGEHDRYAVVGDAAVFVWHEEQVAESSPEVAAPTPSAQPKSRRQSRSLARMRATRTGAAVLTIVMLAGLTTTFTAGNSVPTSYAGTSLHQATPAQLAPATCAQLGVTNLVRGTGVTVTGTAQNDLVLGHTRPGTINLRGQGGNDCIVGAGGSTMTNNFVGGPGYDVCIGNAAAKKNTFESCELEL